jgi:hypothetical protein
MAKATKQTNPVPTTQPEASATSATSADQSNAIAVSLTRDEWTAVLQLVEVGIKTVGATAFEQGGALMRVVAQQVKSNEKQ